MQQQALQQTININVADGATGAAANAAAGHADAVLASTGTPVLVLLALAFGLIVAAVVLAVFARRRFAAASRGGLKLFSLAALLGVSIASLAWGQYAALAAPSLAIDGDTTLNITVPHGGGAASATTSLMASSVNATGYQLTAQLATTEPGIGISLHGGDVAASTPLTAGATPLVLKNTTTANATGASDTTAVTLDFTVDASVTSGTKQLTLNYVATDNAPAPGPVVPRTMQEMSRAYCRDEMTVYNGTNPDAVLSLVDERGATPAEHRTYQVAKLADGNCWMLNNLKLGGTAPLTLTPADSDVASNFNLPQLTTNTMSSYDVPGVYGPVPGDTGAGATNYGYLYNWAAVTAGETRASHPVGSGNAPHSICPANWRLPHGGITGDAANEFDVLSARMAGFADNQDAAYQSTAAQHRAGWLSSGAFRGALSGRWQDGFINNGYGAYIWSSTDDHTSIDTAFLAYFDNGAVYLNGSNARSLGHAVRCVAK